MSWVVVVVGVVPGFPTLSVEVEPEAFGGAAIRPFWLLKTMMCRTTNKLSTAVEGVLLTV